MTRVVVVCGDASLLLNAAIAGISVEHRPYDVIAIVKKMDSEEINMDPFLYSGYVKSNDRPYLKKKKGRRSSF